MLPNLIHDLLVAGVSRAGSLAVNKLLRVYKVEAAIRGVTTTNETVKAVINDFRVIVDTDYSLYKDQSSTFFKELESSGILTSMVEEASTSQTLASTKHTFSRLHNIVFDGLEVPSSDLLYNKMVRAFSVSVREMCADPALAIVMASLAQNINSRISELSEYINPSLSITMPFENYEILSGYLSRMTKLLMGQYKNIRIETNKGAKLVDLQKVYIPSKVRRKVEVSVLEKLSAIEKSGRRSQKLGIGEDDKPDDSGVMTFSELQRSMHRAVILGDPGGGKSTLCQFLCYQLAKQYGFFEQYPEVAISHANLQLARVPIRVVLRNFEAARNKEPQLGVFDYIVKDIRSAMTCTDAEARYALEFCLSLGKAVLAFDGLDEILNTSTRRDFVALVAAFCDEYPLSPVIVTSRLVGYEDASLPEGFDELLLEKFDLAEIENYVTKVLKVVAGVNAADAAKDAQKFMQQTSTSAGDLRQNPLLLGLMAFIFANKGDVPTNRPEIYQECAIMMFEKWDQNRNIRADIPAGFDLLNLFSEIAAKIYGNTELEEGVHGSWLKKINQKYFEGQFESPSKSIDAGNKVTAFVTGRSWVMSEFGADVYRFTHRTFLEYFFARHLNEHQETVAELMQVIVPKIKSKEWDVIAHLSLQIKTFRNQKRTAQAIIHLADEIVSLPTTLETTSLALFASATLQYLSAPESDIRRLLGSIFSTIKLICANDPISALRLMLTCNGCHADRRDYIQTTLADLLLNTIQEGDSQQSAFAIAAVSSLDFRRLPPRHTELLPSEIAGLVTKGAKRFIHELAESDPFYAGIYWDWYSEKFEHFFKIHNFHMLIADRRPVELTSSDYDPGFRLIRYFRSQREGDYGKVSWVSRLRVVGQHGDLTVIKVKNKEGKQYNQIFVSPSIWIDAIPSVKRDPFALRGLVMCMIIHFNVIRMTHRGMLKSWPVFGRDSNKDTSERLIAAVDLAISQVPEGSADFQIWQDEKNRLEGQE